jgi:sporulation-control protein spo0M
MFGLFGSKAELEVELDRAAYLPGDTVQAKIAVKGTRDLDVQAGRVELRYKHTYKYRYRDTDGDSQTSTGNDTRVLAQEQFLAGGTLTSATRNEYTVEFALPAETPPTGKGDLTGVEYTVHALLDVRRSRDVNADAEVVVLSRPDAYRSRAADQPSGKPGDDCTMQVRLAGRTFRPGETVSGALVVTSHTDFNANEVRIELVRHEEVPQNEGNTHDAVVEKIQAVRDFSGRPGETQEYPFQFTLSRELCPSLITDKASVLWGVRGVVARRLRSDYNAFQEFNVYTGPPPAPADQ